MTNEKVAAYLMLAGLQPGDMIHRSNAHILVQAFQACQDEAIQACQNVVDQYALGAPSTNSGVYEERQARRAAALSCLNAVKEALS